MVAHVIHWATRSWIMLAIFLGMLAVGISIALIAARGRRGDRILTPISTILAAAGLLGAIVVGATSAPGFMHRMMGGGSRSMMGSGETGRSGNAPIAGAREVRVIGREFSFTPVEVRFQVGETVNVLFENRGRMFHTLTAGGLGLDLRANDGDEVAGSFTVRSGDSYSFVCTVPGHAEAGMRGTVTVST